MDDCADICEPTGKNMQYGSPMPLEQSYQKNPFDFCFEQARKQNITHRYVPTISTINQTSPLNTPSISLNEGAAPWLPLPLTTPMVGTSAIEVEPEPPLLQKTTSLEEPTSSFNGASRGNNNNNNNNNINNSISINNNNNNQRSNVVSVICPPSAKTSDSSGGSVTTRSAPVLTDAAANGVGSTENTTPDIRLDVPKSAPELTCLRSYPRKNKPPLLAPITLPFLPLPNQEEPSLPTAQPSLPNSGVNHLITPNIINNNIIPISTPTPTPTPTTTITRSLEVNDRLPPSTKSLSSLIKIVPKPGTADSKNSVNRIAKQLNISSLPPKRKEKSEEELLSRLKATEAALPPKAKPGRKSRTAAEEDAKDRKKRSLERNRAAAMRCRLKKKKEIDELKIKVDEYEEQNNELRKVIEDLCAEVRELKKELMHQKECNESALR